MTSYCKADSLTLILFTKLLCLLKNFLIDSKSVLIDAVRYNYAFIGSL